MDQQLSKELNSLDARIMALDILVVSILTRVREHGILEDINERIDGIVTRCRSGELDLSGTEKARMERAFECLEAYKLTFGDTTDESGPVLQLIRGGKEDVD